MAFVQSLGIMQLLSTAKKRHARIQAHHSNSSFNRLTGITSEPGDLPTFSCLIRPLVSPMETGGHSGRLRSVDSIEGVEGLFCTKSKEEKYWIQVRGGG